MGKAKDFITTHKTAVIIAAVTIVVIIGLAVGIPCGIFFAPKHGQVSTYSYDKTADFDLAKDGYVIKKSDDKDFKVLNIADLQMSEVYTSSQNKRNYELVRRLVEQEKPDLLTFTGDNFWLNNAKSATKKFIKNIDSLGVPWAPVFGNHEPETEVDKNWIIEQFLTAQNCIFNYGENANRVKDLAKGPNNIDGVGNYVINVLDSQNKIIHTIFMIDSHSNNGDQHPENVKNIEQSNAIDGLDGWYTKDNYIFKPNEKDNSKLDAVGTKYDFIKANQIEWYEWVVKGVAKLNNAQLNADNVVPSSAYFHIPLPEFNIAYAIYEKELTQKYGSIKDKNGNYTIDGREEVNGNFGLNRENVCSPYYNSGFFAKMQELKSTKDVIVGHDHVNNSSVEYKGIRLTYGLKTGDGCYWDSTGTVSGGTVIAINNIGGTKTAHKYMPFN